MKLFEETVSEVARELGLHADGISERLAYLRFTGEDARCLAELGHALQRQGQAFVDSFYDHLGSFAAPKLLLGDAQHVSRLKDSQKEYFSQLFNGHYGPDYVINRLRVGVIHQRVGLDPQWYLGAYSKYLTDLLSLLQRELGLRGERFIAVSGALVKIIFFDLGLALDAYFFADRKALLQAQEQADLTFDAAPMGLLVLNEDLRVLKVNPEFRRRFGVALEKVVHAPLFSLITADHLEHELREMLGGYGRPRLLTTQIRRRKGTKAPISARITIARIPFAEKPGLLLAIEDLTRQEQLQESLKESEETLLRAQAVAAVGSWRLDFATGELDWSPETHRIFGRPAKGRINYQDFLGSVHPDDRELVDQAWKAAVAGAGYRVEHRVLDGDAERWVEERAEFRRDARGVPLVAVGTVQDITERKFAAMRIERLAFYDSLTGLPNRVLFMERLRHALVAAGQHRGRLALLYLDLDRFKEINDAEGHHVGDRVLVEVARRLHCTVPQEETIARLSSDEFAVLVGGADEAATAKVIADIQDVLGDSDRLRGGASDAVRASMGIAFFPDDGKTADELLVHAEIAMYQAKARGVKHYFYRKHHGEAQRKRYALARRLEKAIAHGQLTLVYQPQVALDDGRLVGAEALMRWEDPEKGWISPAEFIPVAEEHGLISEIGRWALHQASAQAAAWRAAGTPMRGRIAVNVSARQFDDPRFFEDTLAIVRNAGAVPEDIELEVTESSVMKDPLLTIDQVRTLADAGFTVSIDDFGTGYSSLAHLKRLPVSKLKIDISFVRDMLDDRSDYAIVSAIIAMGHSLGIATVAEGAETVGQVDALRAMGCAFVQGYYFGRPLSVIELTRQWLKRRNG